MRLVDAEAIIEVMKKCAENPENAKALLCYRYAQRILEEAPTVEPSPPWHRVEDELPKFGEYVLAWEIQGFAVVDKYVGIGDGRWDLENDGAIYTHWMPLPEPPKEDA